MQAETSGIASHWSGLKRDRVQQPERTRGRKQEFLYHGFSDGWSPQAVAYGLRASRRRRFKKNWVRYEGAAIPSSESLTHAAIYESELSTTAVIHCHDSVLWRTLLDRAPTTSKRVPTARVKWREIIRLFTETDVRSRKIFVMAGHEGGIVTLGKNF